MSIAFTSGLPLTLRITLELQLVDRRHFGPTPAASDVVSALEWFEHRGAIRAGRSEAVIEVETDTAPSTESLGADLESIHGALSAASRALHVGVCGGGTHPFHCPSDAPPGPGRRIGELEVDLASRLALFGVRIHVGCPDGDAAIRLTRALGRYVPHLIAIAAASPFRQGLDTSFASARANAFGAAPLAGPPPPVESWREFAAWFDAMRGEGFVETSTDLDWDVRPRPELGTVEIRVCDTPLTAKRALSLAGYVQALAAHLVDGGRDLDVALLDRVGAYNRHQACRFGLDATLVAPESRSTLSLEEDVMETMARVAPYAEKLGAAEPLRLLPEVVLTRRNDATRIREEHARHRALADIVRWQCEQWSGAPRSLS